VAAKILVIKVFYFNAVEGKREKSKKYENKISEGFHLNLRSIAHV